MFYFVMRMWFYLENYISDTPLSLQSLCRLVVRRSLGDEANKKIPLLGNIHKCPLTMHNVTSGVTRGRLQDLLRHKYVDPGHFDPDTRDQVETSHMCAESRELTNNT